VINADKPQRWKKDIAASVDLFNTWFRSFAPSAYRKTRSDVEAEVKGAFAETGDLADINSGSLRANPQTVKVLRMATAPPIARDRLVGLAYSKPALVKTLEAGSLPSRTTAQELDAQLSRIGATLTELLDIDIFPWLAESRPAADDERDRAATIVADRLCGAVADPIIRNAQERRQFAVVKEFLEGRGYSEAHHLMDRPITEMAPGTFQLRMNVTVGVENKVKIPIDIAVQPEAPEAAGLPIFIEAKSAGDYTNTNKRRKEEATKVRQLVDHYGDGVRFVLFLCGYFNSGFLGYEAAEGIDWVWEHRVEDLMELRL